MTDKPASEETITERTSELSRANERLHREIIERKKAEEDLKYQKTHLESLIQYSSLAIVTLDDRHRIISCNSHFEKLFKFEKSEITGRDLDEVVARQEYMVDASSYTKKTLGGNPIHGYGKRYRKDGTLIDVEFFGVPVIIKEKVVGAYGIYLDISELKRAEEALRESEERYRKLYERAKRAEEVYRSLINSFVDPIAIYDMEGNARYISPAFTRVFGWTLKELEGRKIPFVPESERNASMALTRDLIENGTPFQGFETRRYTKDGRLIEISISASRYYDHKERPAGMLVILRDISERKGLEAQLLHAHKMEAIGTLAGGIAHDFNNLLQAISGYSQLLLMKKDEKHPDFDKLDAIEKSARRASELTQRLLIFGRKVESKLRPVDLNHEVEQVFKLLERTIPRMIEIELNLADDLKIINADPVQLEQVTMNLGVNARDAMPDGGKLLFETENTVLDEMYCKTHLGAKPGEYVLLTISDSGHGMDKEVMEHLFEPFFTTKETGRGTGLGLAMVYGIVKSHGGYITCYSEVGRGTTFKIYFPVLKAEGAEEEEGLKEEEQPGGSEMILLVDDEETILDISKDMLERFGYTTISAESGEKAIEIFSKARGAEALENKGEDRIDLVILDLNMPGMGGHKCLTHLLKIDPHIKVIIASGYSAEKQAKEALEAGAVSFLGKPYRLRDMLKTVREVLDK